MKKKWNLLSKFFFFNLKEFVPYCLFGSFIICWWMIAFKESTVSNHNSSNQIQQSLALNTSTLLEELSPLQRETLKSALGGDISLMIQLIDQWELDASILKNKEIKSIHRLPSELYFQAQILSHLLQNSSPEYLRHLNCKMNLEYIRDDCGREIRIEDKFNRFLPQTFVAASFLLAIAPAHEIIALPKGMRYLSQLYSKETLNQISSNIERLHSEKLYLTHPDLAFVAPYSHPPALEVLRNQDIQLCSIKFVDSVEEIQENLLKVGHASNHILEAQLLAIFMEASMIALDNRLQALHELNHTALPRHLLYLYYHQHYMLPTTKSLTGQLLTRALQHCPHLTCPIQKSDQEWSIPFEQEKILHENPDFLLISTPQFSYSHSIFHQDALQQLKAFKTQRIFYVDETIQESPTQYIVLAYFDLFQVLAATYTS